MIRVESIIIKEMS